MKIEHFAKLVKLSENSEIQKVELVAFYFAENKGQIEISVSEVCNILFALGYAKPNASRLKQNMKDSKSFVNGSKQNTFRLSVTKKNDLKKVFPDVTDSEEIISDDTLIPEILLNETHRQYLIKIVQQINASYENNLFDACALVMRRLLEILIIHSFEKEGIESEIQDIDGNYQNLKTLINKLISSPKIHLSASSTKNIDQYRELGNLSAHRVKYNCRRNDIKPIRMEYRALIEELLYKADLKK